MHDHDASAALDREYEIRRQAALDRLAIVDTQAETAYDDLARLAQTLCATPMALLSLIDRERQWFKARIGISVPSVPRAGSFCEYATRFPDRLLEIPDARVDQRLQGSPYVVADPFIRFYAGAPIVTSDGNAVGTICVMDTVPRALTEAQREGLMALARQSQLLLELRRYLRAQRDHNDADQKMARALRRQRNWLRYKAMHDPLTGLLNRAGMDELHARPDAKKLLQSGPYVFALADIDHFKQINDRHGHLVGDEVLRAVAKVIADSVRSDDVAIRYGGEEFLLVFPRTSLQAAHEIAERLCSRVRALELVEPVRLSVGLAAGNPPHDGGPEEVFARADQALYSAKQGGRDRVAASEVLTC